MITFSPVQCHTNFSFTLLPKFYQQRF